MVADWMRVGFVHGVMNTDNMSILGLTIDYGPYGWIDDFDPDWTPNTTDAGGRRYRFGAQEQIAYWNLARFAEALAPVLRHGRSAARRAAALRRGAVARHAGEHRRASSGSSVYRDDDLALMRDLQDLLHQAEVDMTIFFRRLAGRRRRARRRSSLSLEAFYSDGEAARTRAGVRAWLERYAARAP